MEKTTYSQVVTFRLDGKDEKWLAEYLRRIGMRRSTFLRGLVTEILKEMQKKPLPEPTKTPLPPAGIHTPTSPRNTTFWKRYKDMVETVANREFK